MATSLLVFIVVYFFVFGAGTFYILRLMNKAPGARAPMTTAEGPLRTSGITPGAADRPRRRARRMKGELSHV